MDIAAGNTLVERIKPLAQATARTGSFGGESGGLGGFGALFDLKAAGYEDPLLVSGTDGVGTKLRLAIDAGKHDTVGIDLVAMCVNDLSVQGAEPLFFLDYFATAKLSIDIAESVVSGIAAGCKLAGCALIGGETAEMPGMYEEGDYDLAGFAVGAVERTGLITGTDVAQGDVLLGLASSGVHSNGFSLVRKVMSLEGVGVNDPCPWAAGMTLGAALLEPTRIYSKPVMAAIAEGGVHGLSHITGGGFFENLPRMMAKDLACVIDMGSWPSMAVFDWIMEMGGVEQREMYRTFNCGIGMVLAVSRDHEYAVTKALEQSGEAVYRIGEVTTREKAGRPVLLNASE